MVAQLHYLDRQRDDLEQALRENESKLAHVNSLIEMSEWELANCEFEDDDIEDSA